MPISLPGEQVDRILRHHPAPIADAVYALEAADNLNERRDRVVEVFRTILRLLSTLALAARIQRGHGSTEDNPQVRDLLVELRRRGLTDGQWLALTRELLRPWASAPVGHPLPSLVELVHGDGRRAFAEACDGLLRMRRSETIAHGRAGETPEILAILNERVPQTAWLLGALEPIWKAARLVVPTAVPEDGRERQRALDITGKGGGGKWMRRELAEGVRLSPGEPILIDGSGMPILQLNPVALWREPMLDRPKELFLLEGGDKKGAVFRSYPACSEHCVPEIWKALESAFGTAADAGAVQVGGETRPFRGLASFERKHAALFFGREVESQDLANRVRESPVVTVTGASGAGKTSLLQAGVLPNLAEFEAMTVRPGAEPLEALSYRLTEALRSWPDIDQAVAKLRERPETLGESLLAWVAWKRRETGSDEQRGLLIIDQAEEVFTLCADVEARHAFAAALASMACSRDYPLRVILSIRGDFMARLAELKPLQGLYNRDVEVVTKPDAGALERALTAPAELFGFHFEDETLLRTMISAVADAPAALALLEFCADRMWEARDRAFSRLTWDSYRAMNGVAGAIADHAERELTGLSAPQQDCARRLLVQLVTEEKTRRVVAREELLASATDRSEVEAVLDRLVRARLLVAREAADASTQLELIHEALLTHWPRFRRWLEEDLEGVIIHTRLGAAAQRWEREKRASGFLLREGKELVEAETLERDRPAALTESERALLVSSRTAVARRRWTRRAAVAALIVLTVAAAGGMVRARQQEHRA